MSPLSAPFHKSLRRIDLDVLGTTASLTCAVHCALMPLVVALLPLAGLGFLASETTEQVIFGTIASIGVASLVGGYRRHGHRHPLVFLVIGLALLALGHRAEEGSRWVALCAVLSGGLIVAASHWINRSLYHAYAQCSCPTCDSK